MRAFESECAIDMRETFEQPTPKKSGAAGDKNAAPAQRFPKGARVRQDVLQIFRQRVCVGWLRGHDFWQNLPMVSIT